jgi:hypothetical protein
VKLKRQNEKTALSYIEEVCRLFSSRLGFGTTMSPIRYIHLYNT